MHADIPVAEVVQHFRGCAFEPLTVIPGIIDVCAWATPRRRPLADTDQPGELRGKGGTRGQGQKTNHQTEPIHESTGIHHPQEDGYTHKLMHE